MTQTPRGFLPGRHPLDAVGQGGFRFSDMSHRGSVLILPSGIHAWDALTPADITPARLKALFAEAPQIDFVLIGTGSTLVRLDPTLLWQFRERGLNVDPMTTLAAARTYNVVVAEGRRVAAALLALE